jgi:hypothetical protein
VVVEADASGALGDEHTFTIDVDRTDGKTSTPAAGVVANFTFTGPAGSLVTEIDGVADPNATSCPTNGAALCTVTVDSDTNVGDGVLTVTSIEGDLVVAGNPRRDTRTDPRRLACWFRSRRASCSAASCSCS